MNTIFNNQTFTTLEMINFIKDNTNGITPFFQVTKAPLGADTIMLLVSFDPKEKWNYGYVENSQYFRMMIESNGTMEVFVHSLYKPNERKSQSTLLTKFRKYTAKDKESILKKLIDFIEKIKKEIEISIV
jgi:hypothetical protein